MMVPMRVNESKMKNIVYLLGAGSSKDFGMPLGNEIFEQAYRLPHLMESCQLRTDLISILGEADKHLEHIFTKLPKEKRKYPPFEEVLTFLADYKKSERWDYGANKLISVFPKPGGVKEVFDTFVKMLGLTLAGSAHCVGMSGTVRPFMNFIKSLFSDGKNVSFISMNYDTLVDQALLECANSAVISDFTYAVPLYDIASERGSFNPPKLLCRESGVYLLKPHGSLNLVYCPHSQVAHERGAGYFYSG
jgi:hypothetical protein